MSELAGEHESERGLRVVLGDDHAAVREGLKALSNGQSEMTVV